MLMDTFGLAASSKGFYPQRLLFQSQVLEARHRTVHSLVETLGLLLGAYYLLPAFVEYIKYTKDTWVDIYIY